MGRRSNDFPELPPKERERIERREKKRCPKMVIDGRGTLTTLARIIQEKAEGIRPLTSGKKKKRRKKR